MTPEDVLTVGRSALEVGVLLGAPLLLAAEQLALSPADCLYVGDDRRDVTAGRAAGMRTLAAAWGYISEEDPIDAWGADAVVDTPAQVAAHALPAAVM